MSVSIKANGTTYAIPLVDETNTVGMTSTPATVTEFVDLLIQYSNARPFAFPVRIKFSTTTYAPPEIGANWALGMYFAQNLDRTYQNVGFLLVMNQSHVYFGSVVAATSGDRIDWTKMV